jgi:hypothetical protein
MFDKVVAALKPRSARYAVSNPQLRGHWVKIQPSGSKTFWTVTRNPQGKLDPARPGRHGQILLRKSL